MRFVYYYIIILFLFCSCYSKESLREQVVSLYEQGKQWEKAVQADSAVSYYLQSFSLAKELKDDSLAGDIGNTLGDILNRQGLFSYALSVHKEAYFYNNKLEDKTSAFRSLRGIGEDYIINLSKDSLLYDRRIDSAYMYFNAAKKIIPRIKNKEEISLVYNNLCALYIERKEFLKALEWNHKAINFTKDSITIYENYCCRGKIYFNVFQIDSAIYYCKQAQRSSDLYTQRSACYQLSEIFSQIGSSDSTLYLKKTFDLHAMIESQKREEEIMQLFQKTTQDGFENEKKLIIFGLIAILLFLSLFGFIFYKKYNRRKLLKKNNIISFQRQKLAVEQERTQLLRKEVEEIKQITNYAELRKQKQREEAKIILQIIQLGEDCSTRFQTESFYENISKKLNEESELTNEERKILLEKVNRYFALYVQEIDRYIQLAEEDYFVCCLTLLGFSTKYCAICRGVGEAAIRVQRKRIKEKLKGFFHSEKLYNSIFGQKV